MVLSLVYLREEERYSLLKVCYGIQVGSLLLNLVKGITDMSFFTLLTSYIALFPLL